MKFTILAALLGSTSGVHIHTKSMTPPDVYGPNGSGYTNVSPNYDMSRIGIDITEKGKGPQCTPRDWAQIHYKGILKDGRVISDSHSEGMGYPLEFSVGASEVFRCWDLVLPQLHEGDSATISCPSYYVYGDAYTQAPLGGETIPLQSDVDFEIEVVQCAKIPDRDNLADKYFAQPHTTTMQPNRCFYLRNGLAQDEALDWVLTSRFENGQHVAAVEHKVLDDPEQHWYWDLKTGAIQNEAYPALTLDSSDGFNRLVLAKKNGNQAQGGFDYQGDRLLTSGHYPLTVNHNDWTVRSTSAFSEGDPRHETDLYQGWHIEYCWNERG